MRLDGKFSYKKENQRTLSFNVDIQKLPKRKTVFAGSSSKPKLWLFPWREFFLKSGCPGNYSVYGFEIRLSRSLGPFILSIYLPSAMFVMMSWVSFFVPPVTIKIILFNAYLLETAIQQIYLLNSQRNKRGCTIFGIKIWWFGRFFKTLDPLQSMSFCANYQ